MRGAGGREQPGATAPSALDRLASIAGRALLVAAAVVAVLWLLARLRLVLLPLFVALLLATVLTPPARWLQRHGWPPLAATWAVFAGFLLAVGATVAALAAGFVHEFANLGPTLRRALDDVQGWLTDGPFHFDPATIERYRESLGSQLGDAADRAGPGIVNGALVVTEVLAGAILALVITFFLVKDGEQFTGWALRHVPEHHHGTARAAGERAWEVLRSYLRAAALLGIVEGVVIGGTLALVGAPLAVPVGVLTFLGAFFPLVGAVFAGVVATLVALVGGGGGDALVVAIVAVLVQQFDADLLAPFVYGRTMRLHPLAILLSIAAGSALAGIIGAFLAVPVLAVAVQVAGVVRGARLAGTPLLDITDDAPAAPSGGASSSPVAPPARLVVPGDGRSSREHTSEP